MYEYPEICTKVKCINTDCYWNSGHEYCVKDRITINGHEYCVKDRITIYIDVACECYEPQKKEDTDEN